MEKIWTFSEDASILAQLLALGHNLTAGTQAEVCAVAIGEENGNRLIAGGADKVYILYGDSDSGESYAQAFAELTKTENPTIIFVGATQRGKDFAAKVAAMLNAGLVTEAFAVRFADGAYETDRMMYGGLAICTEILSSPSLVTIPVRTCEALPLDTARHGERIKINVTTDKRILVNEVCPIVRGDSDITVAERLVCVGRGLAKQDDMKLAEELAAALGAELGCTRGIAEDYHWLPNERYIGLSGQKVKPEIYLSLGVSGQVQHVAGIRDSKLIVAVDMNENAPIFEAADYGVVGDLYEIAPLLTEAIKKATK